MRGRVWCEGGAEIKPPPPTQSKWKNPPPPLASNELLDCVPHRQCEFRLASDTVTLTFPTMTEQQLPKMRPRQGDASDESGASPELEIRVPNKQRRSAKLFLLQPGKYD